MMLSDDHIRNKILNDKYNSIVFDRGRGREVYLVGGFLRDTISGTYSADRDYVLSGDVFSFTYDIQQLTGGTIVKFKKEGIVRLVVEKNFTLDFSPLKNTLRKDLLKRDFSINAIAWSPVHGLIDLCRGISDINTRTVRSISRENFIADPLRMLRAYRFAAELQGTIESSTRKQIKTLNNKINKVSNERITLELFYLLNSAAAGNYLKHCLKDGLLNRILSLSFDMLHHNIKAIIELEKRLLQVLPHTIKVILNKIFSQNITYKGLWCLETLFLGCSGREIKKTLKKITVSSLISKRLYLLSKEEAETLHDVLAGSNALFDIFMSHKDASVDFLIIMDRLDLLNEYWRFQRIWKRKLICPHEIMQRIPSLNGERLGKAIIELKKAYFTGRVKTKKQAILYLEKARLP